MFLFLIPIARWICVHPRKDGTQTIIYTKSDWCITHIEKKNIRKQIKEILTYIKKALWGIDELNRLLGLLFDEEDERKTKNDILDLVKMDISR